MMKTRLQRTELLRAAQALSTPKRTAAMVLVALLVILTFPTKTWAQDPIAKIGDTPYESLQDAFRAAADGSTITLLADADLGKDLIDVWTNEGEKNLTFDLNNFSLTGTDELFYVRRGGNLTIKGGTVGGPNADNHCSIAIRTIGGKVNIENLTVSNCRIGLFNDSDGGDEETAVAGELTIGSGVNISATETCIDNYRGKLTLTALPILSWSEEGFGISIREGEVIHFAGEGIIALPEGFKPIKINADSGLPRIITDGYADHLKSGSEVIDPAKVFVGKDDDISLVLYDGEILMVEGGIQKVSVTKGDEVKEYYSLQDAFDEAADGSTVTLLDNADLRTYEIDIMADEGGRSLTFDLNGFSLTGTHEILYVHSGVNLTVKDGSIGGPDADNTCYDAIFNRGGKVYVENLTISNCNAGIYNGEEWLDEETSVAGELTIGSGVNISVTERCIDNYEGELTLTALPILSWGEKEYGITLGEGKVIHFAGEGITALPEGFKPIMISVSGVIPCFITDGYADHVKSGSEVIDPAKVFVGEDDDISIVLYGGEAIVTYGGGIQNVSVTKGNEVKQYISLQTAFDEAADGSTITLLDNADLGNDLIDIWADEGERNLTFDLNGFSLTGTSDLLYVRSGVNITIKGGAMGSPSADNPIEAAICIIGGKVYVENLTGSNWEYGIYNENDWPDEETSIPGELTIGSGVHISAAEICIENYEGKLTLTALPILSWGEEYYGISLGEGKVINFAGEGVTALPEGFKPIKILAFGELPRVITNGYSTFFKNIDPADVFVYNDENIIVSITLEGGETVCKSAKVSFPEGLSTFFSPYSFSVDNKDVRIYTVTAVEEGKVTVAEVKSKVIPRYTPVIISNESSETLFDPNFMDLEECDETFENDIPDGVADEFWGTNNGTTLTYDAYDYYGFDGKNFVWMKNGSKVAPHRCWIEIPNENYVDDDNDEDDDDDDEPIAARRQTIVWPNGDTTAVHSLLSTVNYHLSTEMWYTLDGRKLKSRPTQKGIYIKNGKKIVIK